MMLEFASEHGHHKFCPDLKISATKEQNAQDIARECGLTPEEAVES